MLIFCNQRKLRFGNWHRRFNHSCDLGKLVRNKSDQWLSPRAIHWVNPRPNQNNSFTGAARKRPWDFSFLPGFHKSLTLTTTPSILTKFFRRENWTRTYNKLIWEKWTAGAWGWLWEGLCFLGLRPNKSQTVKKAIPKTKHIPYIVSPGFLIKTLQKMKYS